MCRGELHGFDPRAEPSDTELAAQMAVALPQSVLAKRQSQAPRLLELVVSNLYEEVPNDDTPSSMWTMHVALGGLVNENIAKLIDKVVYELPPPWKQRSVTTYPPFFSLRRHSPTAFTVRCQVHWNLMLGMNPTEVDHPVMFRKDGNRSVFWIDANRAALDVLELDTLARAPRRVAHLQLHRGSCPVAGVFNALGLEVSQRAASGNLAARFSFGDGFKPLA